MEKLLKYLKELEISGSTLQRIPPNAAIEPAPHIHEGWEIKFLTDKIQTVPPAWVHSATIVDDLLGGILFSEEEIIVNRKNSIPVYMPRNIHNFPYEKILEAFWVLPESEGSCRTELTRVFFRMIIRDLKAAPANAHALDIAETVNNFLKNYYYMPDLNISFLAERIGYSQQYLNRKFKKSYGHSIQQALVRIRLEYADGLLRSGKYFVTEAARLTGWSSVYYFSNVYKKHYGAAPSSAISKTTQER